MRSARNLAAPARRATFSFCAVAPAAPDVLVREFPLAPFRPLPPAAGPGPRGRRLLAAPARPFVAAKWPVPPPVVRLRVRKRLRVSRAPHRAGHCRNPVVFPPVHALHDRRASRGGRVITPRPLSHAAQGIGPPARVARRALLKALYHHSDSPSSVARAGLRHDSPAGKKRSGSGCPPLRVRRPLSGVPERCSPAAPLRNQRTRAATQSGRCAACLPGGVPQSPAGCLPSVPSEPRGRGDRFFEPGLGSTQIPQTSRTVQTDGR